jgi:hypothetical protein
MRIAKIVFAREAEVGSRTLVAAAQGDLRTHGQYMSNCEIVRYVIFYDSLHCSSLRFFGLVKCLEGCYK